MKKKKKPAKAGNIQCSRLFTVKEAKVNPKESRNGEKGEFKTKKIKSTKFVIK